jgi:hypothetical protein
VRQNDFYLDIRCPKELLNIPLGWILTGVSLVTGLKEVYEFWTSPSFTYYFVHFENIGQIMVIVSAVVAAWPVLLFEYDNYQGSAGRENYIVIQPWSYQFAAVRPIFCFVTIPNGMKSCSITSLDTFLSIFSTVCF